MQEMLALSSFMTGGAMSDVAALLREAFYRYNSVDPLHPKACVRLATRTMLTLADYCRQHGLYADAHAALMKAQSQVGCCAYTSLYQSIGYCMECLQVLTSVSFHSIPYVLTQAKVQNLAGC